MKLQLVDTHCHLSFEPMKSNIFKVLQRANDSGVSRIVLPAYDLASWSDIAELSPLDGVFPCFGLHPWVADEKLDKMELERFLKKHHSVAIGEIGLDYHIKIFDKDRQIEVFKMQLELALKLNLPVLLHCRGAFDDMLAILEQYAPDLTGVIHAFSKGEELACRFLDLGYMLAFGGAVTRPNAKKARKSAASAPSDSILLETDAPSIGIQGVDAKDVEPMHVAEILQELALIREENLEKLAADTTENAERLFHFRK